MANMIGLLETLNSTLVAHVECAARLREARYRFAVVKAQCERDITDRAGGVKGLGSNAAEQERSLILALNLCARFTEVKQAVAQYEDDDRQARANLELARAGLQIGMMQEREEG